MRARYWLVTDITENEGRRKIEVLNRETRTLVYSECAEDRLGSREGGSRFEIRGEINGCL